MVELAVMDSSAVLALMFNEPGGDRVVPLMNGALLSTVNFAEVYARLLHRGSPALEAWHQLTGLQCEICYFSTEQARVAAELAPITRPYGLSLGDRACLALALERKAPIYTADRVWTQLGLDLRIEVIR
jgi:PIN domain nuclease of toxin-antitoxin system